MKILVTGCAGFVGSNVALELLRKRIDVIGIDNLNDYYDVNLKSSRLAQISDFVNKNPETNFCFEKIDITDFISLEKLFMDYKFDYVIHLAAQAGVRYSIANPRSYIDNNITGFFNIIECSKNYNIKHFLYASSSSVYGLNSTAPFSTSHMTAHPVSIYAASKKSNELLAHYYSHLFKLPTTGLRFFTVYGPWGRPDMAYFSFTEKIINGRAIDIFNNGELWRDFTYIDDIVKGLVSLLNHTPKINESFNTQSPDPAISSAPYRIFNIGNSKPVKLIDFIQILENIIGKKAKLNYVEMQPGDVYLTSAEVSPIRELTGFEPTTDLEDGLAKFFKWYKSYYSL